MRWPKYWSFSFSIIPSKGEGGISGKGKELRKTVVSGKVQPFPINRGGAPDNPFLTMNQAVISTDEMMRLLSKVNPIDYRQSS